MRALKFSVLLLALVILYGTSANAQCNMQTGEGCSNFSSREVMQVNEEVFYTDSFESPKTSEAPTYNAPINEDYYRSAYERRANHNSGAKSYKSQAPQKATFSRRARTIRTTSPAAPVFAQTQAAGPKGYYNPKDGSIFPGGRCDRGKCNKDGSMFGGRCSIPKGKCMRACKQNCGSPMTKACEQSCKPCLQCTPPKDEKVYQTVYLQDYVIKQQDEIYDSIHKCKDLAPLELKHVDFRIKKDRTHVGFSEKLGNYRFRIFGCRRFDKHAMLNQGRIIQKDLQFIRIFEDMVSDCLNIIKTPDDLCDPNNTKPLPEYVLTAEITDYFMNVCDKYDWDKAKKENLRTGSSEMTVTWRLTNVTGTEVVWKGETTGYAEVEEGEYNGEVVLLERAFADAVNTLRQRPDFEAQLAKRVSQEELARQRQDLIELEKIANPVKCQFQEEIKVIKECGIKRVCTDIDTCTGETKTHIQEKETIVIKEQVTIDETSGAHSTGSVVSEDGGSSSTASVTTEKTIVEIDETSGVSSSGVGATEEHTRTTTIEIDETSGVLTSGTGAIGETVTTRVTETIIDETSGTLSSGSGGLDETITFEVVENIIDENSGISSSGIGEDSGQLSSGSFDDELWIDIPQDNGAALTGYTGEIGDADGSDSLCIIDRPPYETLSAENVYKMRSSVVNITNVNGKKGSGLIISNQFILTSADLITKEHNRYDIETINEITMQASAFRINPNKNIALLILDEKTRYNPLPLNLYLPETGRNGYLTLGMLNKENVKGKLEDKARVVGYRYSDATGSEIIVNTDVQQTTIGGALIDSQGTISGISHTERGTDDGNDLFLPITSALKSVGLSICGKEFPEQTPINWYERSTTPISEAIDSYKAPKAPEEMSEQERK